MATTKKTGEEKVTEKATETKTTKKAEKVTPETATPEVVPETATAETVQETTAKAEEKADKVAPVAPVEEPVRAEEKSSAEKVKTGEFTVKELNPTDTIVVRNGFCGKLEYISKKTGERYVWGAFGDEQEMELSELKSARNSVKSFFENNWFMFDDPEVIGYLNVDRYYKSALSLRGFEKVFFLPVEEMEEKISKISLGQKKSLAYHAKKLIASGEIDSRKTIAAVEQALGLELIEH